MQANEPKPESDEEIFSAVDDDVSWASQCIAAMLTRHGVRSRYQATVAAQICAISVSQARRKLRGAVWLFDEVQALCRHFGESLDTVFTTPVLLTAATGDGRPCASRFSTLPATLLIDGRQLACDIQLGAMCAPTQAGGGPGLLARHCPRQGWLVAGRASSLQQAGTTSILYAVEDLRVHQPKDHARARIAVLDDDIGSADALSDWFNEVGYHAQAFTSAEQLLARPLTEHDAFVVDLILAGGRTSEAVVERIREAQPDAPIVLLTGQLRDGTASEATLATLLRTQGVTFFEKPVRPAVLTAAIQSGLDRLATHA